MGFIFQVKARHGGNLHGAERGKKSNEQVLWKDILQ